MRALRARRAWRDNRQGVAAAGVGAMRAATLFALAVAVAVALTLQILSCALFGNWWPLLTGAMYVLVPMPMLFLATGAQESSYSLMDGGADSWVDVAKFLSGARAARRATLCTRSEADAAT